MSEYRSRFMKGGIVSFNSDILSGKIIGQGASRGQFNISAQTKIYLYKTTLRTNPIS